MGPRDHRIHLGRRDSPVSPPQNHFIIKVCFPGPQNWPKKVPGPKCRPVGPKIRPAAPKSPPGHENTKDARRKTMQNPASRNSNGAIWCKLWPKTIFGPNLGRGHIQMGTKWRFPGSFWHPKGCTNRHKSMPGGIPKEALGKALQN